MRMRLILAVLIAAGTFAAAPGHATYYGVVHSWGAQIWIASTAGAATFNTWASAYVGTNTSIGVPAVRTPATACARLEGPWKKRKSGRYVVHTQRYELGCPAVDPTVTLHATGVVRVTGSVPSVVKERKTLCSKAGCRTYPERKVLTSAVTVDLTWIPTAMERPNPTVGLAPLQPGVSASSPIRWQAVVTGSLSFGGISATVNVPSGQVGSVDESIATYLGGTP